MKKNLNILKAINADDFLRRDITALKLLTAGKAGADIQGIGAEWFMADAKKCIAELEELIESIPAGAQAAIENNLRQHKAAIAEIETVTNR